MCHLRVIFGDTGSNHTHHDRLTHHSFTHDHSRSNGQVLTGKGTWLLAQLLTSPERLACHQVGNFVSFRLKAAGNHCMGILQFSHSRPSKKSIKFSSKRARLTFSHSLTDPARDNCPLLSKLLLSPVLQLLPVLLDVFKHRSRFWRPSRGIQGAIPFSFDSLLGHSRQYSHGHGVPAWSADFVSS